MNEENKPQINIKEEVLNKIKSGQINMRSKAYFLVKLGFLSILTVLITLVSIFLLSFVLFSSSLDGSLFLVRFGGTGLYNFILTLPWYLLIVDIFLLLLLDVLLKSFSFGYKSPILFLFAGTFIVITAISTLLNFTPFHQKIMNTVERNKNLPFHNIYDGVE
jgi:hypothetical protein